MCYCFVSYYIILHCIILHYITLHYITLHYITLHYITLHYITLHYMTTGKTFFSPTLPTKRTFDGGSRRRAARVLPLTQSKAWSRNKSLGGKRPALPALGGCRDLSQNGGRNPPPPGTLRMSFAT